MASRGLFLGFLAAAVVLAGSESPCPAGCYCKDDKKENGVKISCHPMKSGSVDLSSLPESTVQLNLIDHDLGVVRKFGPGLKNLVKLDLRHNGIAVIEDGSFSELKSLHTLDLSGNKLETISNKTFFGLKKLERLKLNDNRIRQINSGALEPLINLKKLELSENNLVCDCHLSWFIKWTNQRGDILSSKTKCALPIELADRPLKRLGVQDLKCPNQGGPSVPTLEIEPKDQLLMFEGDPLEIKCHAAFARPSGQPIGWFFNWKPVSGSDPRLNVSVSPSRGSSVLRISSSSVLHSGDWACSVSSSQSRSLSVVVVSPEVNLCSPTVTDTPKGVYRWHMTLAGHTLGQSCRKRGGSKVYLSCRETGEWANSPNSSACDYTSEVTDTLHKFATMRGSFDTYTLLQSAQHFLNYTRDPGTFKDPMDLVFFSTAVENYLPYLQRLNDLGVARHMMEMIANVLPVDKDLVAKSQGKGLAAKKLLDVIDNVTSAMPTFRYHSDRLAIESFKPLHFDGLSCSWYTSPTSGKTFHCSQTNRTKERVVLGSVTVPPSLYSRVHGLTSSSRLTFVAFSNSTLFPVHNGGEAISDLVVGVDVGGVGRFNLTDPVSVVIRVPKDQLGRKMVAGWWDPYSDGGLGRWRTDFCGDPEVTDAAARFSCWKVGYYAVLMVEDEDFYINKHKIDFGYRPHHPIVYTASVIFGMTLVATMVVYSLFSSAIATSRKLKHSLFNVWMCVAWLLFFFITGTHQTDHDFTCRFVGVSIHFLTVSTMSWILNSMVVIYFRATGPGRSGAKNPERVTKYYVFGYGMGGIIVCVTAAIDVTSYSTKTFCFLRYNPLVGAVVAPCSLMVSGVLALFFFTLVVVCVSPSHITEQIEFNIIPSAPGGGQVNPNTGSVMSLVHTGADGEKKPKSLIVAIITLMMSFVVTWCLGALSIGGPMEMEVVFGVLYAMSAVSSGVFVLVYFVVSRADIYRASNSLYYYLKSNSSKTEVVAADQALPPPGPGPSTVQVGILSKKNIESDSDHLSINNVNHLRRGYLAPVNSEADYMAPMTSSPVVAGQQMPHFSPDPYGVTEIRTGDPCGPASYSAANFPSGMSSLYGVPAPRLPHGFHTVGQSSSLPRKPAKHRWKREEHHHHNTTTEDDLQSGKFSAISAGGDHRHRRKRKRRKAKEPVYNNVLGQNESDDHEPPIIEQSETSETAFKNEIEDKRASSTSQYSSHSHFSQSDMPKRETCV